jgi:hypothetical protein
MSWIKIGAEVGASIDSGVEVGLCVSIELGGKVTLGTGELLPAGAAEGACIGEVGALVVVIGDEVFDVGAVGPFAVGVVAEVVVVGAIVPAGTGGGEL